MSTAALNRTHAAEWLHEISTTLEYTSGKAAGEQGFRASIGQFDVHVPQAVADEGVAATRAHTVERIKKMMLEEAELCELRAKTLTDQAARLRASAHDFTLP